jgi:predicted DCC family thiol-disulfide oxidoreductase YuxK
MTGSSLVVWYNTRCPVCDAGIDWQRNRLVAAVRAGKISFKDINDEPDALAAYGASLDDVRRRLHATDEAGRLIVGADVAIAMWRATPGEGWLASLFGNPLSLPVTRFVYDRLPMCCSPGTSGRGIGESERISQLARKTADERSSFFIQYESLDQFYYVLIARLTSAAAPWLVDGTIFS